MRRKESVMASLFYSEKPPSPEYQCTHEQIAQELGLSRYEVATIERKALKKVKLALMELGYDEQYFARV